MAKDKKFKKYLMVACFILLALTLFIVLGDIQRDEQITYQEFQTKVEAGEVTHAYAYGSSIRIRVVGSEIDIDTFKASSRADYIATLPDKALFIEYLTSYNKGELLDAEGNPITPVQQIEFDFQYQQESFISRAMPWLGIICILILTVFIFKSIFAQNNKSLGFGKTKARNESVSKVKFSDVAGAKEEKTELMEVVDFLKNPKKYTELGARIPKGVLLVGPPGTGKTMLAKAVAGESHVPFFRISGSDFVEMFVGVGASRVRDLFDQAKQNAPCIIFIDEIDAVGRQRGAGLGGGNDEREQTLNQLLVEMDGFDSNEGIIVIAATNRPDVLDPALQRPGRFDRQIVVNMPDIKEREAILKVHAKNKSFSADITFTNLARITSGFSGADLENLLNESAILAARDNRPRITMTDVNEAANKVMMGPQKRSHLVTERDKKITAYHESGHAILHKLLPFCDDVQEVSIVPRGLAGGYTMSRPETDDNYATFNKLNNLIASIMGGRIAEEIIFNDISTGASNDIEQATKIARKMVTQFGMSEKLGFINLGSTSEVFIGRDYQSQVQYSDKTASLIDEEMEKILKNNYALAKKLLTENIDKLHAMANLLIARETIYTEEVESIMQGVANEVIIEGLEKKEQEEREMLEKEKQIKKEAEEKRLQEIKERAFNAMKQEGLLTEKIVIDPKKNGVNSKVAVEKEKTSTDNLQEKTEAKEKSDNKKDSADELKEVEKQTNKAKEDNK